MTPAFTLIEVYREGNVTHRIRHLITSSGLNSTVMEVVNGFLNL